MKSNTYIREDNLRRRPRTIEKILACYDRVQEARSRVLEKHWNPFFEEAKLTKHGFWGLMLHKRQTVPYDRRIIFELKDNGFYSTRPIDGIFDILQITDPEELPLLLSDEVYKDHGALISKLILKTPFNYV